MNKKGLKDDSIEIETFDFFAIICLVRRERLDERKPRKNGRTMAPALEETRKFLGGPLVKLSG